MKHFGIVFPCLAIALFMALSFATYPHKAQRGIASIENHFHTSHFRFYDAHYKL